jgi:UTP--glucose-1-phosphate uridylyltransferase
MPASEGGGVRGVQFRGRRFDTGNPVDYLRTIIQFALERRDVAPEFLPWLRKYLDDLP